jgi:hypothetical protein
MTCNNCVHVQQNPDGKVVCKMHREVYKDMSVVLVCTAKESEKNGN